MFDDLLNAGTLALICAVCAAAAAPAFPGNAATPATQVMARADVVTLPSVIVVGRRRPVQRDLALASRE